VSAAWADVNGEARRAAASAAGRMRFMKIS
jgi:hypothetical protein